MNLSSYLSDGRGVVENNMKAPIQPACINVSNWWWWCNGIGDFFLGRLWAHWNQTKDRLNVIPYLSIVADNVFLL